MELNWSTILLEIINFLVLVWILKRFLYRPVLNIIEKRRADIDQTLNDAKKMHADATALQQQYEGRLVDWEQEKQHEREKLQHELQQERTKLFDQLKLDLTNERKKAEIIQQRQQTTQQQHYQEKAVNQGARFASKILRDLATPELQQQLFLLMIKQLSHLPEERLSSLRQTCSQPMEQISVNSAFPLNNDQKTQLQNALWKFCESSIPINYEQNNDLLAGLRISLGSWVLRMNLQDELSGFAALSHEQTY